jgi:L-threonylcarbamoyladenylate synthase
MISKAVEILRRGGLVAFPTETVYGLGADATNAAAVRRIFAAKGRPSTNPIIVHVANEQIGRRYASAWPQAASDLAAKFWPGPLTLVVPRADSLAPEVSAGRDTVGLRAPDHPLALEMLRAFDGPVAAPSANRSTRVSPTTAAHVRDELNLSVDLILDGGSCRVGIESTVLDLNGDVPTILRAGAITADEIEKVIGPVATFRGSIDPSLPAASPGQQAIHYAPRTAAFRFDHGHFDIMMRACSEIRGSKAIMYFGNTAEKLPGFLEICFRAAKSMPEDPDQYAHELYAVLRQLDTPETEIIFIEMPPDIPAWVAVRDRLTRATRPLISSTR